MYRAQTVDFASTASKKTQVAGVGADLKERPPKNATIRGKDGALVFEELLSHLPACKEGRHTL